MFSAKKLVWAIEYYETRIATMKRLEKNAKRRCKGVCARIPMIRAYRHTLTGFRYTARFMADVFVLVAKD